MKVAILGTGGIGLGYAARLDSLGHEPILFSLSGSGATELQDHRVGATGAFDHQFTARVTSDPALATRDCEAITVATTVNHHHAMFSRVVPCLMPHQRVLISAELSLSGSHLSKMLAAEGKTNAIMSLGTTLLTGRRLDGPSVRIGLIRNHCSAAAITSQNPDGDLAFWNTLFASAVTLVPDKLEVLFSNLNPTVHAGNALCNFTRIEGGEVWSNFAGITPGVASLTTSLDAERCAVAAAYGVETPSLEERYRVAHGFSGSVTFAEMAQAMHDRRGGLPKGPASTETRYVTEDVPFGLAFLEHLARKKGIEVPLHRAIIDVFSALYLRDFRSENAFMR